MIKLAKTVKATQEEVQKYQLAVLKQMLKLATNGFGLVAALAWNNIIKEFVDEVVKKYVSVGSGLVSLFIYAIIVTALAVTVTMQLSKLVEKLEVKK